MASMTLLHSPHKLEFSKYQQQCESDTISQNTDSEESTSLLFPEHGRQYRSITSRIDTAILTAFRHTKTMLPGFLRFGSARRNLQPTPTSYLDGMRGIAALIVVQSHASGASGLEDVWILQQPIIRINHGGQAIVDIFFIISGYVLSYRMLRMMRNQDSEKMLDSLASSTFKRFLRLHLPVGLATFISMLMIRLELFPNPPTERLSSLPAQFLDWFCDLVWSANPFTDVRGYWFEGVFRTRYLDQMWTVPVEFRGSAILFSYCAACCKLSNKHRMRLTFFTVIMSFFWQAVYPAMFLGGMLIADISLSRMERQQANSKSLSISEEKVHHHNSNPKPQTVIARLGWTLLFIVGLFCLSQPHPLTADAKFPWNYTRRMTPSWWVQSGDYDGKEHFLYGIGALSLVFAAESYPTLQIPFNTSFAQSLGQISFGIYAVHNMLIWTIADPILGPWRVRTFGDSQWGFLFVVMPIFFLSLCLGDYFTRANKMVIRIGTNVQKRLWTEWRH